MTRKLSNLSRTVLGALAFLAAPALLLPAPASAQATPSRVLLAAGNPQALAAAADSGPVPSSQRVSLTLTLAPDPARAAALNQYLAGLSTPASPSYHQWLTPSQFAASYGATPDQLTAAAAWAQSAGLTLDATSAGATRINVSGSAALVQAAFATSLHLYQINAAVYYAAATQPSLPAASAQLFTAVEGLDDLPTSSPLGSFTALSAQVDANSVAILNLTGSAISAAQLPEYTQLFRQAAAQGITTLLPAAAGTFADTTAVADASTQTATALPRPGWQSAPGLPADNLRDTPDLAVSSLTTFTQTLNTIAAGGRLGNITPVLYTMAPNPGIFTQPDSAPAGTWEAPTGLGVVDPIKFAAAYPRGTGGTATSFAASPYSPTHGQTIVFTSNVTSTVGGPTPTGTVSFVTAAGTTLGTGTLVNGSASYSTNTLDSGTYIVSAVYNGSTVYASSTSPTPSQIYVAPEPSQLSGVVSGGATVGSNYTVTVTDTVTLGTPTGAITVTVQAGANQTYTAALVTASSTSATATVTIPATTPGGTTLSINCSSSLNYSCGNPLTLVVQIAKATPTLSISYSPNPPVSGQQISLNAVVSTVGSAPAPTGNVQFYDNGTTLNAAQVNGGNASTTGTVPTTATHSITAMYDGDSNYNAVSTAAGSNSSSTINTTTQLQSSATSVNAGASITFTATITPASTGPTAIGGSVTFSDGGTPLGTQNVANGMASLTVNSLSSSTSHTITAVYSGDGTYTASTSGPVTLTAGSASNNTTTTLTANTTNPTYGSNVTLMATVAPPSGGATPTGTVTFSNGANVLGTSTLTNGLAVLNISTLAGGMNSITATYNGGTGMNASSSAALVITVAPAATRLSFSQPTNPTFGGTLAFIVAVQSNTGFGYPTGIVTVQPSGAGYTTTTSAMVTNAASPGSGQAALQLQETAAGSVILTATYPGDANFAPSGPTSISITIARAASTTSFSYGSAPPVAGQPVTFTAKVAFISSVAPTGNVQFLDGTTVLGTGTLDSTGTATLTTTLSVGTHSLSAAYGGDSNYLPSNSPIASTGTGTSATTTTLSINPPIATSGAAVMLNAMVGPAVNGVALTGSVQFVSAGTVLCTATVANGSASCTINPTVVGTQSITASYLGDTHYAPSSSTAATLQVTNPNGNLSATLSSSAVAPGGSTTVTATVNAPAGTVPTGTISASIVDANGNIVSTYSTPLPASGVNTATVMLNAVAPATIGNYSVVVSCVNTNFNCNSVTLALTVGATAQNGTAVLTAAVTPSSAKPGATATVTGTLTASTGTALTGTITATITGLTGAAYTVTIPANAITTVAYSIPVSVPLTTGVYTVTVTCASANFTCTPVTTLLTSSNTVLLPTTTTLVGMVSTTATGAINLTATVAAATTGSTAPTGTVTFYDGTTAVGVALIGVNGQATISLTQNTTVTHAYTAVYSGDTVYAASTSPAISGTSVSSAAIITLTASTTAALAGTNVILTAQVTGLTLTGTAPTGTVSFYIVGANARLLGTATLTPQGAGNSVAVLTTTGLPSGTLTIDAVYSGDTNFTTVTSNIVTLGLSDFNLTFNPPSLTIIRGGSGLATATVNFLGGLNGIVTLGCTPAADTYVTCSFSPAALNGTGTSTLNIQTTAPRAALTPPATLQKGILGGISFAALLCLLLPGRNRRRLPTLFLFVLSLGLIATAGCSQNNFQSPLTSSGSPLGTTILTITAAGTDGTNTVRHTYYYQVTIE